MFTSDEREDKDSNESHNTFILFECHQNFFLFSSLNTHHTNLTETRIDLLMEDSAGVKTWHVLHRLTNKLSVIDFH